MDSVTERAPKRGDTLTRGHGDTMAAGHFLGGNWWVRAVAEPVPGAEKTHARYLGVVTCHPEGIGLKPLLAGGLR